MNLEPLTMLSANCILFGAVSLATDQVYRYFKFRGTLDGVTFCFYDNFFYGWYYFICTIYYLLMGAFLLRAQVRGCCSLKSLTISFSIAERLSEKHRLARGEGGIVVHLLRGMRSHSAVHLCIP